jgi:hypothetical protein
MHLLQGKNPDKDKVSVLRSGMEGRSFTSCQLTNYRRDGKAFQNLLCIVPFLDAYDNLLKFIGEVVVKRQRHGSSAGAQQGQPGNAAFFQSGCASAVHCGHCRGGGVN